MFKRLKGVTSQVTAKSSSKASLPTSENGSTKPNKPPQEPEDSAKPVESGPADDAVQEGGVNAVEIPEEKQGETEDPAQPQQNTTIEPPANEPEPPTKAMNEPFPVAEPPDSSDPPEVAHETPVVDESNQPVGVVQRIRRLSFRSFGFFYGRSVANLPGTLGDEDDSGPSDTPADPPHPEDKGKTSVIAPLPSSPKPVSPTVEKLKKERRLTAKEKRASSYALLLRSIIVGSPLPPEFTSNSRTLHLGRHKPPMKRLKSELLKPKEANKLIAEVRNLPTPDTSKGVLHGTLRGLNGKDIEQDISVVPSGKAPIHAVCLGCTDEEAEKLHFARLVSSSKPSTTVVTLTPEVAQTQPSGTGTAPSIALADLSSVIPVLRNLKLIDLVAQSVDIITDTIGSPTSDYGFGQPASADGILAGSVPTSGTVAQGLMQVGQELLNLGFASSSAVVPNHTGIYPPVDRLSVLTYWWGYEVVIPPPSMKYLASCHSIQTALLNFLTAFSLFNNGVRELLPFIRYASQFIDFEWDQIKAQDKGKGVVCAATWVMPAALVPRPWDFADPLPNAKSEAVAHLKAFVDARGITLHPPPLPGTEIIVNPVQPIIKAPGTPPIPMVTLSPPALADAIVETDDNI